MLYIPGEPKDFTLPISMTVGFISTANDVGSGCNVIGIQPTKSTVKVIGKNITTQSYSPTTIFYIVMGLKQWGNVADVARQSYVTMPLSALPMTVVANDITMQGDPLVLSTWEYKKGAFMIDGKRITKGYGNLWAMWIAICR